MHLAISAWRSPATTVPAVELYLPVNEPLAAISVQLSGREVGKLADLLPDLISVQGLRVHGCTNGTVPPELMANLIRNLLALDILHRAEDALELHPEFRSTLMASRLRTVFRPGKQFQARMIERLSHSK